jgi:hypothetical protein
MKNKLNSLFLLGLFLSLLSFISVFLGPKTVHALGTSDNYNPGTNDVAIYGNNAKIDAPYAHFRVVIQNADADVTLNGACLDGTAGSPGLRATIDGRTKDSHTASGARNSDCEGPGNNDLVFHKIPAGEYVLEVMKTYGQGHQAFTVHAEDAPGGGVARVLVTQRTNPNRNSYKYTDNESDNYAVNVWMTENATKVFNMTVPCSENPGGFKTYIKWKDTDIGQINQGNEGFTVRMKIYNSEAGNDRDWFPVDSNKIQKDNEKSSYRTVILYPGDHIQVSWTNLSKDASNVVQHVLPFSDNPDQPPCIPPEASCSVTATPDSQVVGSNVNIQIVVRNRGTAQWPSTITVVGPRNHNPGTLNPDETQTFNDTFTSSTPGEVEYTYQIMDGSDPISAPCSDTVDWQSEFTLNVSCSTLSVTARTSEPYYIAFFEEGGAVKIGYKNGAPFTNSGSWNTFGYFRDNNRNNGQGNNLGIFAASSQPGSNITSLWPHWTYKIRVVRASDGTPMTTPDFNLNRCLRVSCSVNLNTTPATPEPGESVTATYGVGIRNISAGAYRDEYLVTLGNPSSGVVLGPVTNTRVSNNNLVIGPNENSNYLQNATNTKFNYTGTLTSRLMFFDLDLSTLPGFGGPCTDSITPQTRPTFKVTNGDIATGGGFSVQGAACKLNDTFTGGAKPRYISPLSKNAAGAAVGTVNAGGLRAFSYPDQNRGSGADFAAYALGYIDGTDAGSNGFYSANKATDGSDFRSLMFANDGFPSGNSLGGYLGGDFADAHCAADYFNTTRIRDLGLAQPSPGVNLTGMTSDQYLYRANGGRPCLNISGTLSAGARITIYTDDDVCINNNINYANWQINTGTQTNTAPYLVVITKGSIYVQSNVATINGLFVAQPEDNGTKGEFVTCADGANIADGAFVTANCTSRPLNVKGSVIAQHVYPLRAINTLSRYVDDNSNSELFDYLPSMVVQSPNLKPIGAGASVPTPLDYLSSLPPVF